MAQSQRPADQQRLSAYQKAMQAGSEKKPEGSAKPVNSEKLLHAGATGNQEGFVKLTTVPQGGESKYRKVAKLLIVLGPLDASAILSRLDAAQVEAITREIAVIQKVSPEEGQQILEEFRTLFAEAIGSGRSIRLEQGGVDTARALLAAAFGKEKAEGILRRVVPEAVESPFSFMEDLSSEQLLILLKDEDIPVLTLVLSQLSPQKAAQYIKHLSPERRVQVMKRLAKMEKTSPEILEKVAEVLRDRAHRLGNTDTTEVDGKAALAAILRYADPSVGEEILESLEEQNPDLGKEIKERLYTLDDVIRCDERALQQKLRTMEDREIALLLKGQRPEFIDKIKSNLSANRRAMVEEERELLGPVPKRDVSEVLAAFMTWFRQGVAEGTILLDDESEPIK
ncbi:MAG: flagellar motor switch protein FliG [Termitinemataceae bacterium]